MQQHGQQLLPKAKECFRSKRRIQIFSVACRHKQEVYKLLHPAANADLGGWVTLAFQSVQPGFCFSCSLPTILVREKSLHMRESASARSSWDVS
mmetsp:Transcript_21483/g.36812  ORF Transcript_21483/g.36812 Transcript_21483/m.36812 type:complete len:94 (-) Transcript_21483:151-432(-)